MTKVLIATDADEVFDEVDAALGDDSTTIEHVRAGRAVRDAILRIEPDLVILDLQIGNMGGAATCIDIRLEEGAERMPEQTVLLLLDRDADEFLAKHSGADRWIVKPLNALQLRRAATALLAGAPAAALP